MTSPNQITEELTTPTQPCNMRFALVPRKQPLPGPERTCDLYRIRTNVSGATWELLKSVVGRAEVEARGDGFNIAQIAKAFAIEGSVNTTTTKNATKNQTNTQFRTTALYISGALCGHTWMPVVKAALPYRQNARGPWGFWQKGDTFRDALLSVLANKGGDFQNPQFTADTVIRIERTTPRATGSYKVHVKELEIGKLLDCADLIDADTYTADALSSE